MRVDFHAALDNAVLGLVALQHDTARAADALQPRGDVAAQRHRRVALGRPRLEVLQLPGRQATLDVVRADERLAAGTFDLAGAGALGARDRQVVACVEINE